MCETPTSSMRGCFNPRPPPERGATHLLRSGRSGRTRFNPRPPPERGATATLAWKPMSPLFQSTPPSGERSDPSVGTVLAHSVGFNPRPPPERGATSSSVHQRPARLGFQSTPPSGERSDYFQTAHTDPKTGFNPRPPPERGATPKPQPRPPRPKFQSTPPSGERSDSTPPPEPARIAEFQSTPPSGERSDLRRWHARLFAVMVSIHAPLRREERHIRKACAATDSKFQSTPPSGERSDVVLATKDGAPFAFQSTPPSGERSDFWLPVVGMATRRVSIHAPLRREERP